MKKVLFTATVDSHILAFHVPFLKYFKELGYEVHVATNGAAEIPYCDKKIKLSIERNPIKWGNIKAIFQLKKIIKKKQYEIIHTHTPMGSVVTRLAAKQARKQGCRVIYTAHGFHFYVGCPMLNKLLFYPVEKYLSRYTDTLILINQEDYQLANKKFKKCRDICYIPGVGVNENKFDIPMSEIQKSEVRASLGLTDQDFIMLYPAELNKNKNQGFLIQVMEQLVKTYPTIHLLLAGRDSYQGYYQQLVKDKKLENNIHFLGFRTDIAQLFKISNISVASSKREGLPVNIMEAMYLGVPIVALDSRGTRDLVINGENGYLIQQDDLETFNSKIEFLYQNRNHLKTLSENSIKKVQPYLLSTILEQVIQVYKG